MIDDIWLHFEQLPIEIQNKISSKEVIGILNEIEKQYPQHQVSLAEIVARLAIQEIALGDLDRSLMRGYSLDLEKAAGISQALKEKIDWSFLKSLKPPLQSMSSAIKDDDDLIFRRLWRLIIQLPLLCLIKHDPSIINQLIIQLGLSFADETLKNRFNNIITYYLRVFAERLNCAMF